MAEGVKIRIVGDDSEFVRTLEGLEKRAQQALSGANWGMGSLFDRLSANLAQAMSGLSEGITSQQGAATSAAGSVADGVRQALQNRAGAYAAGVAAGSAYRSGLASRRAAIVSTAQAIANAAANALGGGSSGAGVGGGSAQRAIPAVRYSAPSVTLNLPPQPVQMVQMLQQERAAQPIYLNVDGRTLAQVISGDMRASISRRARSVDLGMGR